MTSRKLLVNSASKGRQLAKKMESPKATACHFKQVTDDLQAAQINLMRHKHRNLNWKTKEEKIFCQAKTQSHKNGGHDNSQASNYNKKSFDPRNVHRNTDRCSKCGDYTHVEGFQCPVKKF